MRGTPRGTPKGFLFLTSQKDLYYVIDINDFFMVGRVGIEPTTY